MQTCKTERTEQTGLQLQKEAPAFLKVIGIALLSALSSSFGSPFSRALFNDGFNPIWVACLRMAAMFILSLPAVLLHKQLRKSVLQVTAKETKWILLSGVFLACHFFTLALSINYTTVFGSSAIGSLHYLFTLVIAAVFLHEKPGKGAPISMIMSCIGIAVIGWSDFKFQGDVWGSLYGLVSALFYALYLVVGRYARKTVSIGAYTVWVNTWCAAILALAALAIHPPFQPLEVKSIALFAGIAVFGSGTGHIGINWALKYISSDVASLIMLLLPAFSAVIAYFMFQEAIHLETVLGASLILFGIAYYIWVQKRLKSKAGAA